MAFEITNKVTTVPSAFVPRKRFEVADQGAASPAQDAGAKSKVWRAFIYQKAFTAGTGTNPPIYSIEVADDSGFTSNVRAIASGVVKRADEQTLMLVGETPFEAGQQFGRVNVAEDGTDAATYDAILECA